MDGPSSDVASSSDPTYELRRQPFGAPGGGQQMQVVGCCIAAPDQRVLSSCHGAGRNSANWASTCFKVIPSQAIRGQKTSILHGGHQCHVNMREDGLAAVCVVDPGSPQVKVITNQLRANYAA